MRADELEPAPAPAGAGNVERTAINLLRTSWLRRKDRVAAVQITSINDEEAQYHHRDG